MARYTHVVDAKGRIVLPAKIRENLGESLYVTHSLDRGYLSVYSEQTFVSIKEQLQNLPGTDPIARRLRREIIGEAMHIVWDKQGRIAVSAELWKHIDVENGTNVCLIDMDESVQVCSEAFYDAELAKDLPIDVLSLEAYDIKGIL